MKMRHKASGELADAAQLNENGLGEIIVYYDDGSASSDYIKEYEVELPNGSWKSLSRAMKDHDVITDNYNKYLAFPQNSVDRERGWYD